MLRVCASTCTETSQFTVGVGRLCFSSAHPDRFFDKFFLTKVFSVKIAVVQHFIFHIVSVSVILVGFTHILRGSYEPFQSDFSLYRAPYRILDLLTYPSQKFT